MSKKKNTRKSVPKKVEKPEMAVTIQEDDVKSLEDNFGLDAEEVVDEIVDEIVAGEQPVVEEEVEPDEAVAGEEPVIEEPVIEEPVDESLSDEDMTEFKIAEAEAIAEIANEAEEVIAEAQVPEAVATPKPVEKLKIKKTVAQLTREEYKLYQRTGILPNL
jgi:hypothetical protein